MLWLVQWRRSFRLRYRLLPFCHFGDEPAPIIFAFNESGSWSSDQNSLGIPFRLSNVSLPGFTVWYTGTYVELRATFLFSLLLPPAACRLAICYLLSLDIGNWHPPPPPCHPLSTQRPAPDRVCPALTRSTLRFPPSFSSSSCLSLSIEDHIPV